MEQAPFSPLLFELAQLLSLLSEYDGELGPAASASVRGTPLQAEKLRRIGSKELAENVADQVGTVDCHHTSSSPSSRPFGQRARRLTLSSSLCFRSDLYSRVHGVCRGFTSVLSVPQLTNSRSIPCASCPNNSPLPPPLPPLSPLSRRSALCATPLASRSAASSIHVSSPVRARYLSIHPSLLFLSFLLFFTTFPDTSSLPPFLIPTRARAVLPHPLPILHTLLPLRPRC